MVRLCAGCGKPACDCTPDDVRRQLVADRAELSDRAARQTDRANEAARLIRIGHAYSGFAWMGASSDERKRIEQYQRDADAWLRPPQPAKEE